MNWRPRDIANRLADPVSQAPAQATRAEADRIQRAAKTARLLPAVKAGPLPFGQNPTVELEDERRAKTGTLPRLGQAEAARRQRFDRLPAPVREAPHPLTLLGREVLGAVYRANKAGGDQPTVMPRADLAKTVGVTPDHATRLLAELVKVGALQERKGFGPGTPPRFKAMV